MAIAGNYGNVAVVKLVIACAIAWQLYSLLHFTDLTFARDSPELQLTAPQLPGELNATNASISFGLHDGFDAETKKSTIQNATMIKTNTSTLPEKPSSTANVTSVASSLWSRVRNDCFSLNSDQWISGNIFSNNANGMTPELLNVLIEGPRSFLKLSRLFEQTICHEDSPLRNFSPLRNRTHDNDLEAYTEDWYQRFLYLSLHHKFHRPALEEHLIRKRCAMEDDKNLESFMDHHNIRTMDFECPGQKFLIIPMGSPGFGAFLNTQASLSILLALKSNRIPIFSSKSFFYWQKRKGDQDPWLLAPSHCHRKDLQCYFLPISPCTVTDEELQFAPVYGSDRREQRYLAKNLMIPSELESSKFVVINPGLAMKAKDTKDLRKIASLVVAELLGEWKQSQLEQTSNLWTDEEMKDLAHLWISENIREDPVGLLRQVYVYILRPNPHYKKVLNRQISELIPEAIRPSETIGIPIRGSDKCISESMCLPFDRYMELATDVAHPDLTKWNTQNGTFRPNLILTTEDPKVFNNSLHYRRNASFPFEILLNENDNLQGSGYPKAFAGEGESTIVSSLTALKFHFHASRVYLNCCSNFHRVLYYLLEAQCGAQKHGHDFAFGTNKQPNATLPPPVARCMTDEETPRRFRICCGWSKNDVCADIWKEYISEKEKEEHQE